MAKILLLALAAASALWAQDELSLQDALHIALQKNKTLEVSGASVRQADARIDESRGGFFPKLDYAESFNRSDNPVFVFSSLLTQHQFTAGDFLLNSLNRPAFLDNFQSRVTLEQTVFDGGRVRKAVQSAKLERGMTAEDDRQAHSDVLYAAARAYFDEVLSEEALKAASDSVRSAEADLTQAESVRKAGLSTDADVLSIRVHLACVRERQIQRSADVAVARAALNDALGLALETPHTLVTPLTRATSPAAPVEELERQAIAGRPAQVRMQDAVTLASTQVGAARSALLPSVAVRGAFEADRQSFASRGGANWLVGVSLNWNLFNGFADKARIAEARESLHRTEAERERMTSAVRLEVRSAWENLRAAEERIAVAKASVAEAEESRRITQNRYHAGLSTVTDLLRTEAAVLETQTRYLAALHDQRLAALALDAATGTLSMASAALQD